MGKKRGRDGCRGRERVKTVRKEKGQEKKAAGAFRSAPTLIATIGAYNGVKYELAERLEAWSIREKDGSIIIVGKNETDAKRFDRGDRGRGEGTRSGEVVVGKGHN